MDTPGLAQSAHSGAANRSRGARALMPAGAVLRMPSRTRLAGTVAGTESSDRY